MNPGVSLCSFLSPHREAFCAGVSEWLSGPWTGGGSAFLQEQGCSPGVCGRAADGGPGLCLCRVHHWLAGRWHPGVSPVWAGSGGDALLPIQPPLPHQGWYGSSVIILLRCQDRQSATGNSFQHILVLSSQIKTFLWSSVTVFPPLLFWISFLS